MASDGTDFLVLSTMSSVPFRLYTQKVVNGRGVGPHRQIGDGSPVNLVWTGTDYLAAWRNEGLWVAPVSRDGSPRSTPVEPVLRGETFALAAKGSSVLAFARQGTQLTVLPLNAAGEPAGSPVTHVAPAGPGVLVAGPAAGGLARGSRARAAIRRAPSAATRRRSRHPC